MVTVEYSDSGEPEVVKTGKSRFLIDDGVAYLMSTIDGNVELLPWVDVQAVSSLSFVERVECDEFYLREDL